MPKTNQGRASKELKAAMTLKDPTATSRTAPDISPAVKLLIELGFDVKVVAARNGVLRLVAGDGNHRAFKDLDAAVLNVPQADRLEAQAIVSVKTPDPVYPKREAKEIEIDNKLRTDTGALKSTDPLAAFIYHLLRDELASGVVEGLAMKAVKNADAIYSNGFLLQYAENIANRLVCK